MQPSSFIQRSNFRPRDIVWARSGTLTEFNTIEALYKSSTSVRPTVHVAVFFYLPPPCSTALLTAMCRWYAHEQYFKESGKFKYRDVNIVLISWMSNIRIFYHAILLTSILINIQKLTNYLIFVAGIKLVMKDWLENKHATFIPTDALTENILRRSHDGQIISSWTRLDSSSSDSLNQHYLSSSLVLVVG